MERLGLVGLPNSGKSSLFNALTGAETVVAPHPFSTTETAVGVAQVPDERVDLLGEMSNSKKLVYASFEIVDIAALVKGASTRRGPRQPVPRLAARLRRHPLRAARVRRRRR